MKTRLPYLAAALATFSLISTASLADERGFFIHTAIGQADVSASESRIYPGSAITERDTKDTSFRLGGGYYLNSNVALELSYHHFGEHSLAISPTQSTEFETQAFGAGLRGRIPVLEHFDIYGKLGLLAWQYDAERVDGATRTTDDDNGTDTYLGLGVTSYLSKHWTLELGAERFEIGNDDIDQGSLGITYTFAK